MSDEPDRSVQQVIAEATEVLARFSIRSLAGPVVSTGDPERRSDDPFDVAVMKLTGQGRPPYPEVDKFNGRVLPPSRMSPESGQAPCDRGISGDQSVVDTSKRVILSAPYAYRSDSIADQEYVAAGVAANTHVVLPLNLKRGFGPNGQVTTFPKPPGMSGAPIVVLYEAEEAISSRVFPGGCGRNRVS